MIQIVARRRGRMIRMRMVVTNHTKFSAPGIVIGALGLLGSNQVAGFARLLSFVLCGVDFCKNVRFSFSRAKQKSAAFVRISLLTVFSDSIQVFALKFDCHSRFVLSLESHFTSGL